MISVVVLTRDEEVNLPSCLASASFSEDVLVVDSGSSDRTVEIALAAGARVLVRAFDSFAGQRNFAMEQGTLRFRWVLHLDADEVVTPELLAELRAIARAETIEFPVYKVPSRLIFMGHWLRHAGMYPTYQVRFGRAESLRFVDHGHGQREVQSPGEVGTIQEPIEHFNFSKGVNDWFRRHLGYARLEAIESIRGRQVSSAMVGLFSRDPTVRRRVLKAQAARLPARPLLRFFYSYLIRGGFLDGRAGFHYSTMLAVYQYMIDLNLRELAADAADKNCSGGRS